MLSLPCTHSPKTSLNQRSSKVRVYHRRSPSSPSPSSSSSSWSLPPRCSTRLVSVQGEVGMSRTIPFHFHYPPLCVTVYSLPFICPCSPRPFPVPFFPLGITCLLCCSSCQVWGTMLVNYFRHQHDTQVRSDLQHSHCAVLHVDVGLYSQ